LKGAPPKLDYILRMLKWVRDTGATGIIIEYEDMFPFSGKLVSTT
jgi:hexosaminidase